MTVSDTLNRMAAEGLNLTAYDSAVTNGSAWHTTVAPALHHDLCNGCEPVPYAQAALSTLDVKVSHA